MYMNIQATAISTAIKPLALAVTAGFLFSSIAVAQGFSDEQLARPPITPPGQASKLVVTSSSLELIEATHIGQGGNDEAVEILLASFDIRSNAPSDLLIRLDGECAAWVNASDDNGEDPIPEDEDTPTEPTLVAGASVVAWVELNGVPLGIGSDNSLDFEISDDGSVVFCNSNNNAELQLSAIDNDELIDQFTASRATAGFNWIVRDVGRGFHTLVVKAAIDVHSDSQDDEFPTENGDDDLATAFAVFGKRTMIVERARLSMADPLSGNGEL
jgi:hypothetical protein